MTDHAAAVQGLAAGVGGAILALLGVDAPTLTAALIGAVFGVSFAPAVGRMHAICLFVAAVCASAEIASVLGPVVSAWMPAIPPPAAAKGVALTVGVLLHPLIQAISTATPVVVAAAVDRLKKERAS